MSKKKNQTGKDLFNKIQKGLTQNSKVKQVLCQKNFQKII